MQNGLYTKTYTNFSVKVAVLSTFLSGTVLILDFQKANTGCLVLRIGGVLPSMPQDLGEGYFHVLFRCYQVEISGTNI